MVPDYPREAYVHLKQEPLTGIRAFPLCSKCRTASIPALRIFYHTISLEVAIWITLQMYKYHDLMESLEKEYANSFERSDKIPWIKSPLTGETTYLHALL